MGVQVKNSSFPAWAPWSVVLVSLVFVTCFIPERAFAYCFEEAGAIYRISPRLLWTIAKVESNFDPRALNQNADDSYDFGVMQINSAWLKSVGKDFWNSLKDPCRNVKFGAWILAQCIQRYQYSWRAIGCYNASSESKRSLYAWKVYSLLPRDPGRK